MMGNVDHGAALLEQFVVPGNHAASDYFGLIKALVAKREAEGQVWQAAIDQAYQLVHDEIVTNDHDPTEPIQFGTSGWRGRLGKDVCVRTVAIVTEAIVRLYDQAGDGSEVARYLGVSDKEEARTRGCVVGCDNRFDGEFLAGIVTDVLVRAGFKVHYAGESTTGVLSAAVLELGAAFSINLTPSHNPLEYGGYKYNAADAGPAASPLTNQITANARQLIAAGIPCLKEAPQGEQLTNPLVERFDSLASWQSLVARNTAQHGLSVPDIMASLAGREDLVVVLDAVHGASRCHLGRLFPADLGERLIILRQTADVTFGGIAPEPSSKNLRGVTEALLARPQPLKLGAIIDPDGDRIRFTDGHTEITMNQFGAMAYHFLHQYKGKTGMVAKTVATSNLANRLAEVFGEELFEPRVGFKEFKPVIGRALVYFEESDGISVIGHTQEKDAYIGLILALDMILTTGWNLGEYLLRLEAEYGAFFPDRDGVEVQLKGEALLTELARLEKYGVGSCVAVGDKDTIIAQVITIDGRKMVFEDGSWIMIRPSGTEPKIRFYVESRTREGTAALVATARGMLREIDLL